MPKPWVKERLRSFDLLWKKEKKSIAWIQKIGKESKHLEDTHYNGKCFSGISTVPPLWRFPLLDPCLLYQRSNVFEPASFWVFPLHFLIYASLHSALIKSGLGFDKKKIFHLPLVPSRWSSNYGKGDLYAVKLKQHVNCEYPLRLKRTYFPYVFWSQQSWFLS